MICSVVPIIKKLARRWERCFQSLLPAVFERFITTCRNSIRSWYEEIKQKAIEYDVGPAVFAALEVQLATYEDSFDDLNPILIERMTGLQRRANRNFAPKIAEIMQNAYTACNNEQGKGSHSRMKAHMANYIETNRHTMFDAATDTVKQELKLMQDQLQQIAKAKAADVHARIEEDCMHGLGNIQSDPSAMSQEEKALRREILRLVQSFDARLEPIAKGEFTIQEGIGDVEASNDETPGQHDPAGLAEMADVDMDGIGDFDSESEGDYDDGSDSYEDDEDEFDYSDGDNSNGHSDLEE